MIDLPGQGAQVRAIKGRTDNETQVTIIKTKELGETKTGSKAWKNTISRDDSK